MKVGTITACPTGVAHTYMAAQALETELRAAGVETILAETQGGIGIENEISEAEARQLDVVIMSDDVMIEGEERFEGVPVLHVSNHRIVKDPAKVVAEALALVGRR